MSLSPLLRYVYNHGTEEVIRRGKKIFYTSGVQMLDVDFLVEQIRFRVRNDLYQNYYTVTVNKYFQFESLNVRCQCPYNMGEICRHEVAALFQLNEIIVSGFFEKATVQYDQKHTMVRMRQITKQMLTLFTGASTFELAERMANSQKATFISGKKDVVEADVAEETKIFHVTIKQNEEKYFETSCDCDEVKFPLCLHKTTVFLQVLKNFGAQYFQTVHNMEVQKNKLLEQYGYSLKDNLTNKFAFSYESGKPYLRVLDPTLKKIVSPPNYFQPKKESEVVIETLAEKRIGIVIDTAFIKYPYIDIVLITGTPDETEKKLLGNISKLELSQNINPIHFKVNDRDLIVLARRIQQDEILRFLKKSLPFGEIMHDYDTLFDETPNEEIREKVWEYLIPKYHKLVTHYSIHPFVYKRSKGKLLSSTSLEKLEFSSTVCHPQLVIIKEKAQYRIKLAWVIDNSAIQGNEVVILNAGLVLYNNCVYTVGDMHEALIIENFLNGEDVIVAYAEWPMFLEQKVMIWNKQIHINFSEEITEHFLNVKPLMRLTLIEREQILVLRPVFLYNNVEVKPQQVGDIIQPENGIIKIIKRNEESEANYLQLLQTIHNNIQYNKKEQLFSLSSPLVLSNNWFAHFVTVMQEWQVELIGYNELKNLRINVNKPTTQIQITSGIDWFETALELSFGDNQVPIADIKRAISHRHNFVKLKDGTIGMLTDEWMEKYGLLIKMGETKGNKLRLKKFHFSVLDDLMEEIGENSLHTELELKREKLAEVINDDFSLVKPPEHLQAVLRPYQYAGFHWLKFLNESGWGGILADDMGLGKTVQTLTFFQHYKNIHQSVKFLVICPTTLMYNWENEIKKFTPELTHTIHHGPKRGSTTASFKGVDIIITTYGTMRSDIKLLNETVFDYVVLDESQSIKNPQSQVARASLQLNCKNRLALSGTPVQNNTFDLYAQMNFLNPGMLGSREFFMSEFAMPIDKFREESAKQQLKKLTYPFILRRTKAQVAKDLPDKTETILFCEMGQEQRKIYDTVRNIYRSKILGLIEEQGIERSQLHILQGLTKLRQICDSPAILKDDTKFENHSIKLDELSREITENVGDHKTLVFSQFLGMLALIRTKLDEDKINYVYFDGSSTSVERERAIQEFQNNHECRVFLISLKAGGLGLNLTAADYVYIVDPWWNPAVEQQAIDRTYRIGQTKNIFAYRMICKDTLEEKMLQLQEQKRALANDLISDDNILMKSLNKDDIAFLFS